MKPHVYIFRGAPASGKGTIVPEFAKSLPKPVALIEQDKLRWGFHLIGRTIEEVTPEEHRMAYENTVMLYERYLEMGKYAIILEGLFTWDDPVSSQGSARELVKLAQAHHIETTSIVLKASKEELLQRNSRRSYEVPRDEFEILYDGVYSTIDDSELVIDSSGKSSGETMGELRQAISLVQD